MAQLTPDQQKAIIAGLLPDNTTQLISAEDVRDSFDTVIDNLGGAYDAANIYLIDYPTYVSARATDAGPAIQAIIDSYPNNSTVGLNVYYPSGDTYQSDVASRLRFVNFIGVGSSITRIIPTTITAGTFILNAANCSVQGMNIYDIANSFNLPGFTPNPADTRALVLIGPGGATVARGCLVYDVTFSQSRAQGLRWEGGSVLTVDKLAFNNCCSGGFASPDMNGDCNHFKIRNATFTRCFNFGMYLQNNSNNGGAGFFEDTKFFDCQNIALNLEGSANSGSVFVEGTNGSGEGISMTRTLGSPVVTVNLAEMPSVQVNSAFNNGTTGFTNGTYVVSIDYANRQLTLSTNAISNGTNNGVFFDQVGYRVPSLRVGPRAHGNVLHVVGDNLDPDAVRDESLARQNQLTIVDRNGNTITRESMVHRLRMEQREFQTGSQNGSIKFNALCDLTSGSPVISLVDTTVLNQIRKTPFTSASVTCNGGFSGALTISSVDQALFQITLSGNATATGRFLVAFSPSQAGGYMMQFFDDSQIIDGSGGTNGTLLKTTLARGSRYVGNVTSGSPTLTMFKPWDYNNIEAMANNKRLYCGDSRIVPDGTLISSFVNNGDGTFTVTMSNNALQDATGVFFQMYNASGFRYAWPNTKVYSDNANALAANARIGEIYQNVNGNMSMVVDAANDGRYSITWDPPSVAALGITNLGPFTVDTNGKALANVAVGDLINLFVGRNPAGLLCYAQVTAVNTMDIYIFNPTAGAINLGSTVFTIQQIKP